jgi:hypothetical protein
MAFFYPIRKVAAQAIHSGHLPLWNPTILCGTPLLADVQSAVLYPLNALFWIMPVERAFGITAYLHLVLAALFTVYWLRQEGISRTGSLLGAMTFALSGWSIVWLELPNFMATAVWLPLLLGLLAGAKRGSWMRTCCGCAVAVGMMLTAGHLQIAFYSLLGALLYAVYHDFTERRAARMIPLVLGAVIGLMLAAPQLLPARELSRVSHRSTQATAEGYAAFVRMGIPPGPQGDALRWAIPLSELTGGVAPNLYGNPSAGEYYGLGQYSEVTAYLGILPFLLGVHGLFLLRRKPSVAALALVGGVGFLLALGTPLNALLYFGVPGFARFGTPSRALILVVVAGSGLVGFGWDRLRDTLNQNEASPQKEWIYTLFVGGGLAALFLGAGISLFPAPPFQLLALTGGAAVLRCMGLFVVAAILPSVENRHAAWFTPAALAVVLLDLWSFGARYNLTGPAAELSPPSAFSQALQRIHAGNRILTINPTWPLEKAPTAVLPPNLSVLENWSDVGGYEGAYLLKYKEQLNAWVGKDASPPTNGNLVMPTRLPTPLLHELAVGAVVTPRPLPSNMLASAGLEHVGENADWSVYRVRQPSSRGELYAHWPPDPGEAGLSLEIQTGENPNRIVLKLKGSEGYALLRDANAEGWQVEVDGKPVATLFLREADGKAVKVTAQNREVVWEFRPLSLSQGWKLCIIGGLAWLGLFATSFVQKRRIRTL